MKTVLLAGCGKMGSAMLAGWLDRLDDGLRFIVVDPMISEDHFAHGSTRVDVLAALSDELPKLDMIVLAIKPQMMSDALPDLSAHAARDTVWLSIAAGITTEKLKSALGDDALIIRTMPNTPAAIGKGITAMLIDDAIPNEMKTMAQEMMAVIGQVVLINDELDMDRVTAVSGSGPAYVFLMREALERAAVKAGLPHELASQLAAATLSGAVALMDEGVISPEQLRINVTSPNGTTQAALDVLMAKGGLSDLMEKAVLAARDRSIELGK
jgi:pyrroline-5-carboxylate reductase